MQRFGIGLAFASLLATQAPAAEPPRRFKATTEKDTVAWQEESRKFLAEALKLGGLPGDKAIKAIPFDTKVLRTSRQEEFTLYELELNATRGRRTKAVLTTPIVEGSEKKKFPAVVCIHGHGGSRYIVYDPLSLYRGFATDLARSGYVTISVDVGQHNVYEEGRTLMGERLWELVRCVDYLVNGPAGGADRVGWGGVTGGGVDGVVRVACTA